jgi:hypothetical protein
MAILNLTQHQATADQIAAGVVDMAGEDRAKLIEFLTFEDIPTYAMVRQRAYELAGFADKIRDENGNPFAQVMIGGAPFFMSSLESALYDNGFSSLYAFSKREVVEEEINGVVTKVSKFVHKGFVQSLRIRGDWA